MQPTAQRRKRASLLEYCREQAVCRGQSGTAQCAVHARSYGVQVRLNEMQLHRPRQWGACWLACVLYEQLEGTCWRHILQTLVCYRLIDPGSEWGLHRLWFENSAMGDLLDEDYSLVEKNALYRCLDKVLEHKRALFGHLKERWQDLFQ